jgi:hypothetical protein
MTPGGGANFDPRAIICTILLEVHYTIFHAKYLTSSICQFREDDFSNFYYIHKRKTYDPPGAGIILTLEANFEQLW